MHAIIISYNNYNGARFSAVLWALSSSKRAPELK